MNENYREGFAVSSFCELKGEIPSYSLIRFLLGLKVQMSG